MLCGRVDRPSGWAGGQGGVPPGQDTPGECVHVSKWDNKNFLRSKGK